MRLEHYEFWKVVEDLGWWTKTTDYEKLRRQLNESKYDVKAIYEIFSDYKVKLKHVITKWEEATGRELGIGDDSFDDITSHIIGLGRKEYEAVYINPELAYARAQNPYNTTLGYKESFAYVFNSW